MKQLGRQLVGARVEGGLVKMLMPGKETNLIVGQNC